MVSNDIMRIKQQIQPTIRIGKRGITLRIIQEINNQLNSRGIIKIKVLKNFGEEFDVSISSVAEELSKRTNSKILEIRGRTFILFIPNAEQYKPKF